MRLTSIALAVVWLAAGPPAAAQNLARATPESVGLSSAGLTTATAALQAHVDAGDVAGVVAAVARHGKLVYLEALGQRDLAAGDVMPENAIFRLYSMTRPITSTAVMMLWEDGKFQLDDPVSRYIPEFEDQRVFLDASDPDLSQTRARAGDITVRHLLTHSSGIGSRSSAIYRAERVRLRSIPLTEMVANAARVPLFEDPGTRFRYGISTTMLGRLVEIWSDQPFEEFLQQRVLTPLGMTDTVFWTDGERVDRLTSVYRPDRETGTLHPHAIEEVPFTQRPALVEGGVGLLSSVMDYVRFSQMLLNAGELDGTRVLRTDTVALMTRNHLPDSVMPIGGGYMAGSGWGLGFNVVLDASAYAFPVGQGEYWWDGSSGTRFSIDPEHGIVTVIMAAVSPSRGGGFREEFKELVYGAIVN